MPRVVGGELAGRTLYAPQGWSTRPTLDRVREALFSILAARVVDAVVLDLYAGTGALAVEALSRGARLAILVESDGRALSAIRRNLDALDLRDRVEVLAMTAERAVRRLPSHRFDLVFVDPPWSIGVVPAVARELPRLVSPSGLVIVERAVEKPRLREAGLVQVDERRYGRTKLDFWAPGAPS